MEAGHGTELVRGAVYEFHKPGPGQRMEVEIVFMHGLQLRSGEFKSAYFKTWTTRDGQEVWSETWLKAKYPHARILSLAYDSSARKTQEQGNLKASMLGATLLDMMVLPEANIGQHGCPVVFVCHSLGGLIAKEIVVRCNSAGDNLKYHNLLQNIKAFFFYATPHGGSDLVDLLGWIPHYETSSLVEYLKCNETTRSEVHANFLQVMDVVMKNCKICVVAEGQETNLIWGSYPRWVVRENSARFPGLSEFLVLGDADHITVCKPHNSEDAGYLKLTSCISQVIQDYHSSILVCLPMVPIGIDRMIAEVCERLERTQIFVVGLFGMGGVGKTILSKMVYNLKACDYAKSCYLEKVKLKKDEDVQKQLLQELCVEKLSQDDPVEMHHLDKIKECFATERVLVVFDDVISQECLEASQMFRAFEHGSQSKVIVTGRDKGVLPKAYEKSGKVSIVSVDGIRDGKGSDMQLFAQYAFKYVNDGVKERVRARFQKVANEIVELCNGLPLSLEVIGRYLGTEYKGDDEGELCWWTRLWTEACEKLQTAQSFGGTANDTLWSSLRVSYDGLAPLERAMFLDFACIFSDGNVARTSAIKRIWDSESGVQNLLNKSLLKERRNEVSGEDEFVMHDQLRDMGRYLLWKEAVKERPLYLWEGGDDMFTLKSTRELKNDLNVPLIAGLNEPEGSRITAYYSKLRFLHVRGCDEASLLDDCLSKCSGELRWLHLYNSKFTELSVQTLGSFKGLRVLQIDIWDDLVELPSDIGKLVNLVELSLENCENLQSLPKSIGKLKKLKILAVTNCGLESIPSEVGYLSELEELSFECCPKILSSEDLQLHCVDCLKELKLPFIPKTCLPACPQLEQLWVESTRQEVEEFPLDYFKVDMPKLWSVKMKNLGSGKIVLHNPDGSTLEIKVFDSEYHSLNVIRNPNGSIQKLENFSDDLRVWN